MDCSIAVEQILIGAVNRFEGGNHAVSTTLPLFRRFDSTRAGLSEKTRYGFLRSTAGTRFSAMPSGNGPGRVVIDSDVVDLSETASVVSMISEMLRHRDDIRHGYPQRPSDFKNTCRRRIPATEHGDTGWGTERLLDITAMKYQTSLRQSIQMRRNNFGIAVTAQLGTHIIRRDEKNIRLVTSHQLQYAEDRPTGQ